MKAFYVLKASHRKYRMLGLDDNEIGKKGINFLRGGLVKRQQSCRQFMNGPSGRMREGGGEKWLW